MTEFHEGDNVRIRGYPLEGGEPDDLDPNNNQGLVVGMVGKMVQVVAGAGTKVWHFCHTPGAPILQQFVALVKRFI